MCRLGKSPKGKGEGNIHGNKFIWNDDTVCEVVGRGVLLYFEKRKFASFLLHIKAGHMQTLVGER